MMIQVTAAWEAITKETEQPKFLTDGNENNTSLMVIRKNRI